MLLRLPTVVLALLAASSDALADGCKFARTGRLVPEREQRALIEWADGTETLTLAVRSDPTTEGNVWVVPVRAPATRVSAEPVEEFPAVTYYETLRSRADRRLREFVQVTAVLDSGGLLCPVLLAGVGGCGGDSAGRSAVEHSRVEKLGMVVTVVSAESKAELERYLDGQGIDRAAADLSSLDDYFGPGGYAFVCGWLSGRAVPVTASAIKVVFPSPTAWYPLKPTRVYTDPLETVVYVRGFVKPAEGITLKGLKCEYVYGNVQSLTLEKMFDREHQHDLLFGGYSLSWPLHPLTRVALPTNPKNWDQDLELVPGTTATGTVALAITGQPGDNALFASALLGALLGSFLPCVTVPRARRRPIDWLAGALTGAAIVLTIWASLAVFFLWRTIRLQGQKYSLAEYFALPVLALAHLAIVYAACQGLGAWLATDG